MVQHPVQGIAKGGMKDYELRLDMQAEESTNMFLKPCQRIQDRAGSYEGMDEPLARGLGPTLPVPPYAWGEPQSLQEF